LLKDYLVSSKNRSIPPLQTDDDLICDKFAKCELINVFFSEQSNLDDSNSTVLEPIDPLYDKLTQLHITETDIEDSSTKLYLYHKKLRVFLFLRLKLFRIRL
jgi:hypothetical protein